MPSPQLQQLRTKAEQGQPESQFLLSQICRQNKDISGMIHWLQRACSTLWFRNCFADGRVDDRSLHAGEPVKQGEKWVVTKWFREKPTRYLEF